MKIYLLSLFALLNPVAKEKLFSGRKIFGEGHLSPRVTQVTHMLCEVEAESSYTTYINFSVQRVKG